MPIRSRAGWRRCAALLLALALAACASTPTRQTSGPVIVDRDADEAARPGDLPGAEGETLRRAPVQPLHMRSQEPVRVGLILPFSAPADVIKQTAAAMFDSAQLAAFEAGDARFLLIPKDTRGTAEGAALAARAAIADGAEILLGPLFSEEVSAVSDIARAAGVPVVAFSSDLQSAGEGVYLLSFPPELEIARVTDYSILKGLSRFGLIAPANEYGERVSAAFAEELFVRGGVLVHEERYEQEPDKMLAPAKRLAQYSRDVLPPGLRSSQDPRTPASPTDDLSAGRGYQAVLMPEQGTLLRALAPLLPYYNVDIKTIKLLGISAWQNPRLTREPALRGGWFAAPDPDSVKAFEARFTAAFGAAPPRLASLSYDATLLAARLAQDPRRRVRFSPEAIASPNGFVGADGLFRLRADGKVERGLAVLEIQPSGFVVIDPAPRSFAPGS